MINANEEPEEEYPCKDISGCSGNSDANCHRVRLSYAMRLVRESDMKICIGCIYNEQTELDFNP